MKSIKINARISLLLLITLLIFTGCQDEKIDFTTIENKDSGPPASIDQGSAIQNSFPTEKLKATKGRQIELLKESGSSHRVNGSTTYIDFEDETACMWNSNICSNTFVTWPGYIQNTGYREWGYAWMSNGPGSNFISYGTGDHFHIIGLSMPDVEPNPKHTAMFGSDWFAFYMQKNGTGRINFDLTEIKVKGTVPITLYFKTASGSWMYWPSIGPGWWYLPGARNIQEFHIRAASGRSADKYSIDDIQIKGL